MLKLHPSARLEYRYFKLNAGAFAIVVDWIERRKINQHLLRVSIHSPHGREVIFKELDAPNPSDNFITTDKTTGSVANASWDLSIDLGNDSYVPDIFPAGLLRIPDMRLASAPLAKFSGWIKHGSEKIEFSNVSGLVSQYWGRHLTREWWWVSAHQFDKENIALECSVFRSAVWGTRLQFPSGFFYLHMNGKREFIMSKLNDMRVTGTPENFQIKIRRLGKEPITLTCAGRAYGDFGDNIVNTLTGDLEIRIGNQLIATAKGTAGLEHCSGS